MVWGMGKVMVMEQDTGASYFCTAAPAYSELRSRSRRRIRLLNTSTICDQSMMCIHSLVYEWVKWWGGKGLVFTPSAVDSTA